MQFAAFLGVLSLLTLPAFSSPPKYALIQAKVKPGQSSKTTFNNYYLALFQELFSKNAPNYPILLPHNEDGVIVAFKPTAAANGSTPALYSLELNRTAQSDVNTFLMDFSGTKRGLWQQVFTLPDKLAVKKPPSQQGRFYANGTQLLWSNNNPDELFESWLVCNYVYGYYQLLFKVKNSIQPFIEHEPLNKLPSSCALVDLVLIPVQ